jgi:hypothetical protein
LLSFDPPPSELDWLEEEFSVEDLLDEDLLDELSLLGLREEEFLARLSVT